LLVNKCTCVCPSVTKTDFMTVVEDNTFPQLWGYPESKISKITEFCFKTFTEIVRF